MRLQEMLAIVDLIGATRRGGQRGTLLEMLTSGAGVQVIELSEDQPDPAQNDMLGRGLSRMDLSDYAPRQEESWTRLERDGVLLFSALMPIRYTDSEETDTCVVLLVRDSEDTRDWRVTSIHPASGRATAVAFRGDEAHAVKVGHYMADFYTGRLSTEEVSKEMRERIRKEMRERIRRKREAQGKPENDQDHKV